MGEAKFSVEIKIEQRGRKTKVPKYALERDISGTDTLNDFMEHQRMALIEVTQAVLEEEISLGFPKDYTTIVDGKKNRPIESVKTFGNITIASPSSGLEVFKFVLDGLRERSKIVTGQYISSFQIRVNSQVVAYSFLEAELWMAKLNSGKITLSDSDVIIFVNTAPYARKLERLGVTSKSPTKDRKTRTVKSPEGRSERMLAPNGVFYLTHKATKRKYPSINIKFDFMPGARLGGPLSMASFKTHKGQGKGPLTAKEKKNPRTYLYPVIIIRLRSGGIY